MITTDLPQYDDTVEITLETVIQKEDEILVEIANEHVNTRKTIQRVGTEVESKISLINDNTDLPLNERMSGLKLGTLTDDVETTYRKMTSDPYTITGVLFGGTGELFCAYRIESGNDYKDVLESFDGNVFKNECISNIGKTGLAGAAWISRNLFDNKIYYSDSYNKEIKSANATATIFATMLKKCLYFYLNSPNLIYLGDDGRIYKKDLGTGIETLIPDSPAVKNKIIWNFYDFIYCLSTRNEVFKINVNTLEITNMSKLYNLRNITEVDSVILNGNDSYVAFMKNGEIVYTFNYLDATISEVLPKIYYRPLSTNEALITYWLGTCIINNRYMHLLGSSRSGYSGSSIELASRNILSFNDKKANMYLKKGAIVNSLFPISKLDVLSYVKVDGNIIKDDGIYSLENENDFVSIY